MSEAVELEQKREEALEQAKVPEAAAEPALREWQAVAHLLKGNIGPGLLSLPLHFTRIGPLVGLLVVATVASQGIYGMRLLLYVQRTVALDDVCRRGSTQALSFEDVGLAVVGQAGRRAVQLSIGVLQFGICTVFISLIATNWSVVLGGALDRVPLVFLVSVLCALLSLLPNLGSLALLSSFGNSVMFLACGSVVTASLVELAKGPLSQSPLPPNLTVGECLAALTAMFYAFEGVALILPIGNQLTPEVAPRYPRLVVASLCTVASLFAVVGLFCGLAFHVDSASITAFLARRYAGSTGSRYFEAVNLLVSLAVLLTFPLQLTPIALVLDNACELRTRVGKALCRLLLVACCLVLVLTIPSLDVLIDLFGAVGNTALAALPCVMHAWMLLVAGAMVPRQCAAVILDGAIVLLCTTVMVLGICDAAARLVNL